MKILLDSRTLRPELANSHNFFSINVLSTSFNFLEKTSGHKSTWATIILEKKKSCCTKAFFPKWGSRETKRKRDKELPPSIPPSLIDLQEEYPPFDETYVPEVSTEVSLNQDLVKTLSSEGSTSVRVKNVTKIFAKRGQEPATAAENVNLNIQKGQLVALIGTSGSGKTTLMRMIAGLESPTEGSIFFNDEAMNDIPVQDRNVGVMFQSYALFKHRTVLDNVTYGLTTSKRKNQFTKEEVRKMGMDLLELVQLSDFSNRYPQQLSGGQKQRVALARALATKPRVLLLDEPFGALDTLVKEELTTWLRKLQQELQITTIMVTHDQDEALGMADWMIVFHKGKVVQMGKPHEVFQRPNSPFVMNFMCEPKIFRSTANFVHRSGLRTAKPYVLLRPDTVVIHKSPLRVNTTPATVKVVRVFGPAVEVELKFDDGDEFVFIQQRYDFLENPLEAEERVYLQIKPLSLMPCSLEELK